VSHTNLAESPNAVCVNSIGHDWDSPNAVSSDAANAKCPCEPNLRSQRCWCKPINAGRVNGIGAPNLPSGGLLGWWRRRQRTA
jgi:hypothetical protein